jgi:hypothetical protein
MGTQLEIPSWQISGIVTEIRDLTTKKDNTVWAHSIKCMGLGGAFDLFTRDQAKARSVGEGMEVFATGGFATKPDGNLQFEIGMIKERGATATKPAQPASKPGAAAA